LHQLKFEISLVVLIVVIYYMFISILLFSVFFMSNRVWVYVPYIYLSAQLLFLMISKCT